MQLDRDRQERRTGRASVDRRKLANDAMRLSTESRALGAAVITVTMWASSFVAIRALAGTFSPGSITIGRLLVGIVVFVAVALPRSRPVISRSDLICVLLFGVLWFGLYSVGLNAGERQVDAGTAVMLVNVGPILIALFARLFLREGLPAQVILGCFVAFLGTAVVAASSSVGGSVASSTQGVALVLSATVAYAAAATFQKRALQRVPAGWVNVIGMLAACVVCLPFAPGLVAELRTSGPSKWAWLVYLGVFPTAIGFTTWAYALARTSAVRTAAVTYLMPPVTIGLSWLVLAEFPRALAVLGGAICLAGVALARSKSLPRMPRRRPRSVGDG
jgi:drug/metabolite transporter (DMT)-like permease